MTRWVNDTMSSAGIDIHKYVTHSCRAAASSFAFNKNIPLKTIMDSCGWSSAATFANHYKKTIVETLTIGERILQSNQIKSEVSYMTSDKHMTQHK